MGRRNRTTSSLNHDECESHRYEVYTQDIIMKHLEITYLGLYKVKFKRPPKHHPTLLPQYKPDKVLGERQICTLLAALD